MLTGRQDLQIPYMIKNLNLKYRKNSQKLRKETEQPT